MTGKKQHIFACRSASSPSGRNDKWRFLTTGLWFILTLRTLRIVRSEPGGIWSRYLKYSAGTGPTKGCNVFNGQLQLCGRAQRKESRQNLLRKGIETRRGPSGRRLLTVCQYLLKSIYLPGPSFTTPVIWWKCVCICVCVCACV